MRSKIVMLALLLTVLGLGVAGMLTFSIMLSSANERVDRELLQEVKELEAIAQQRAADGAPFTSVTVLLQAATDAAVPSQHESVLALTNGQPKYRPRTQDFNLTTPAVLSAIRTHERPGKTVFAEAHSPKYGKLRLAIASVEVEGDSTRGTYVIAYAVEEGRQIVWQSATYYAITSLATLVLVGSAAWVAVGRVIRPLETLSKTTEKVTVEHLGHRVPVPANADEITALAERFNLMLERLESGYSTQKQFLRDAGHELRTPITIVRGTIEMLEPDDHDFDESKDIVLDELDRMARIVGDLSVLAQAGQPDFVRTERVPMRDFAHDAIARMSRVGERTWTLAHAADMTAMIDRQRLMQAVVQLAANAVQYSSSGTTVELSVHQRDRGAIIDLVIAVKDHGIGIDPADQKRIFERFVRIDNTREHGGSGLGLSIVAAIAEAHGGHVELESEPGHGSLFSIVIPQQPSAPDHERKGEHAHSDR